MESTLPPLARMLSMSHENVFNPTSYPNINMPGAKSQTGPRTEVQARADGLNQGLASTLSKLHNSGTTLWFWCLNYKYSGYPGCGEH